MKKVFFAFAVVAGLAMTACNNKPAETTDSAKTDTTAVSSTTTTTAATPVDTASAPAATADTAKMGESKMNGSKTETKSESKMEKKESSKK